MFIKALQLSIFVFITKKQLIFLVIRVPKRLFLSFEYI